MLFESVDNLAVQAAMLAGSEIPQLLQELPGHPDVDHGVQLVLDLPAWHDGAFYKGEASRKADFLNWRRVRYE